MSNVTIIVNIFHRNHPINMANNPAYVHRINEDDFTVSGSQTQSNTYESVTAH